MGYCDCESLRICDCGFKLLLGRVTVFLGCCVYGLLLLWVVAIMGYFDCGQRVEAISDYCNCGPICNCDHAPGPINGFAGATAGYDRMFGAIGLAVLSGLGRRSTHPERWIHLPFRGH